MNNNNDNPDHKLPPDDTPRFAYEQAEEVFDQWAAQQTADFQRAWMKAKFMAAAYAYGDFFNGEVHPSMAMSRGWEELQIAFTGRGEAFLSGAVLELYCRLPNRKKEREFAKVVTRAFNLAEECTPGDAERLYMRKDRTAAPRGPDEGFTLDPLVPCRGIRLREWAMAEGVDPDAAEEQLFWLELADRQLAAKPTDEEPEEEQKPTLRLLQGGQE